MPLPVLLERLTWGPARILGLEGGHFGAGAPADVCIFDPEAVWVLEPGTLRSRGQNSPFVGWELLGRVTHTLLAGRAVHEA